MNEPSSLPPLPFHPSYARLVEKARASHERNRSPEGIDAADVAAARLYAYAFRLHTIGTFHATRLALASRPAAGTLAMVCRGRAAECLSDLGNQAMEPVPRDFRAVISTFYRYHQGVERVLDSLQRDAGDSRDAEVARIAERFREIAAAITGGSGIYCLRDTEAPEQASFIVPNLGITIVPLVYGDHHSWALAWLGGKARHVPTHLHRHGVEIHLGYNPTHGMTVLGHHRATVDEGYAMPIPPNTDHGWVNTSSEPHHVPFIFGSLKHSGWGIFLDVIAQTTPVDELTLVPRDSVPFSQMVYLERHIEKAESMQSAWRTVLIPASATNRQGSGGIELSLTRVNPAGYTFAIDEYRIVSVARGRGHVNIAGAEQEIAPHDHFGIPGGLSATLRQTGTAPLVVLDTTIKGHAGKTTA